MRTLRDVLARLTEERLDLGNGYLQNLGIAVGHFEAANGLVALNELDTTHIRAMMRYLMGIGRSAVTVNNNRRAIMRLWEQARELGMKNAIAPFRDVRRLKEPERVPTAWRQDQLAALVSACRSAKTRRGWGPLHWEGLTLTVYDTSLRLGCLLKSRRDQFDPKERTLYVPGEIHKGRRDTLQNLHPDTCAVLERMLSVGSDDRLFPWPFCKDDIWRKFTSEILLPAGLPHSRRDKFHKVRRTSYTYVACAFGVAAASDHASHKEDLSRFYLDPSFLNRPNPLDALPRPVSTP